MNSLTCDPTILPDGIRGRRYYRRYNLVYFYSDYRKMLLSVVSLYLM